MFPLPYFFADKATFQEIDRFELYTPEQFIIGYAIKGEYVHKDTLVHGERLVVLFDKKRVVFLHLGKMVRCSRVGSQPGKEIILA